MTVTYDADKGTLGFGLNGVDHGIQASDLPTGGGIYPAVSFYGSGRSIAFCGPPPVKEKGLTFGPRSASVTLSDDDSSALSHVRLCLANFGAFHRPPSPHTHVTCVTCAHSCANTCAQAAA